MSKRKPGPIADGDEVLTLFTNVMRGKLTEEAVRKVGGVEERVQVPPKLSDMVKAA